MQDNIEDLAIRLQGIIDTAIDGIITIDANGMVETINKSAAEQFEYSPSEVIGNNVKMLMPNPYHAEHDGYIKNYQKTKKPKIIGTGREVVGKRKNGDLFPFRLAVSEVILNDRIIYTGIIHDLSDVKSAEKKLLKLNLDLEQTVEDRTKKLNETVDRLTQTNIELEENKKQLDEALKKEQELNELKSRFVSMASHEFRTPLSTIMSSASLISRYTEGDQQEKRTKHIDRIKSSVNNLTGILNDFLSLGKIEEGKVELNKEDVQLLEVFKTVKGDLKEILKPGQSINIEKVQDLIIQTDERLLRNILFNLLSNGIKYSDEQQAIHCEAYEADRQVILAITDEGIGIPEGEQKHLFERFFRASNVENIQGTGLGLNIVKRYCELLEGSIEAESTFGKGTKFTVIIPKA